MIISKLTDQSVLKLYEDARSGSNNVLDRYLKKTSSWEAKGKDKLDVIADGFYELNDKLFDSTNQYKYDKKGPSGDFENAKIIYTELSDLTPSDANDPRFWTRLTHEHFHNYTLERWYKGKKSDKQLDLVMDRSFFIGNSQRTRTHNSVARLWWIPYLTIRHDEADEEKKWELTKAIFKYQELHTSLLERNMGTYDNVRIGFLEFYVENEKKINSAKTQSLLTSLNK